MRTTVASADIGLICFSFFSSFRPFPGFLGQFGLRDALFQLGHLVAAFLAVAEFLLDRLHLLVEIILALGLLHLPLDARTDPLLDLQDGNLALHEAERALQPLLDADRGQHFLLFRNLDGKMRGDGIGQFRIIVDLTSRTNDFRRYLLVELYVVFKLRHHGTRQCLDLDRIFVRLRQQIGGCFIIRIVRGEFGNMRTVLSFNQDLDRAIRQFQQLQDIGDRTDIVDVVCRRIVVAGIHLCCKQDLLVGAHHLFKRAHRPFAPDEERYDHVGKDNNIAQRQHRKRIRLMLLSGYVFHFCFLSLADRRFRQRRPATMQFLPKWSVSRIVSRPRRPRPKRGRMRHPSNREGGNPA